MPQPVGPGSISDVSEYHQPWTATIGMFSSHSVVGNLEVNIYHQPTSSQKQGNVKQM